MKIKRIVPITLLCVLIGACGRVPLYNELTETQANEMAAVLLTVEIEARKALASDKVRWTISVKQQDIPYAMEVLAAHGLPGSQFDTLGDVFKKKGFVSSPLEEKARYLYGLSQELAHTLSAIDGVLSARVHIALPERDFLSEESKPSSASVVLVTRPDAEILQRETDVKAIVKDSIEGLDDVNKVTVKYFAAPQVTLPPKDVQKIGEIMSAGFIPNYAAALLGMAALGGGLGWLSRLWLTARRRRTMESGDES